jgi:hypothetical protein
MQLNLDVSIIVYESLTPMKFKFVSLSEISRMRKYFRNVSVLSDDYQVLDYKEKNRIPLDFE